MVKITPLTDITAGFASNSQLNDNFDEIEAAFDNTLSRDGSGPNQMEADLDMNSNDILNGGSIEAADIVIGGLSLIDQVNAAAASASAAATSATNAATSATNAENAFDSFDDIYLGAKAGDPALDNDGNPLQVGALYFNTTTDTMRVFTSGLVWADLNIPTSFLSLSDTPSSYATHALKFVRVNAGATGLEFVTTSGTEPSDGDKGDITVSGSGLVWDIDAGVVGTTELADLGVTTAKLDNLSVTTGKIAANAVDGTKIAMGSDAQGDVLFYNGTDYARLAPGTSGQVLTTNGAAANPTWETPSVGGGGFADQLLHVRDEKAANTSGGTFTSGAWRTRTLNTVKTNEIAGASVASNQITLPAGTYWIEADAPASNVDEHKARLFNITDTADIIIGTIGFTNITLPSWSSIRGRFTLAAPKVIELQHRCSTTQSINGFGRANNLDGKIEVYSDVRIWKVG